MKNKKILLSKVKEDLTRRLQAVSMLLIVALMIFNTTGTRFVRAADNGTTTMTFDVTGGVLEILNVESTMAFSSIASGTAGTSTAETGNIVLKDYRASPGEFGFYANSNDMEGQSDDNYTIDAANLVVFPSTATIYNIVTFNNAGTAFNSQPDNGMDANILMFNSAHNAVGAVGINGLEFNMTVNDQLIAQTYQGTLFLTVIAI